MSEPVISAANRMSSKTYRRPGVLERFFLVRQYLGFDSCVIVTAKYIPSTSNNERISQEELFTALARVVRENPILTARIKDEKVASLTSFERFVRIDLNAIITFTEDRLEDKDLYKSFHERQLATPIPNSGETPLWRLSVSADNFLVFAWSHVIGDGQSGLALHRLLLDALNTPELSQREGDLLDGILEIPEDDNSELLPSLENLTDLSVSFRTHVMTILTKLFPLSFLRGKTWQGNNIVQSTSAANVPKVILGGTIFLPPSEAGRLLDLTRKNSTTLTATLAIAGVSIISNLLAEQSRSKTMTSDADSKSVKNPEKFTDIPITIPVSLRTIAGVSNTAIGNIVSAYNPTMSLFQTVPKNAEEVDWDKAASLSKTLRKVAPKTREYVGIMGYYISNKFEEYFKGRLGSKREFGFGVSNLGSFRLDAIEKAGEKDTALNEGPASDSKRWTIGRTCFMQSHVVLGAALRLSVSGGPDGSVNIAISWAEGAVDTEFAEAFTTEFQRLINSLSKVAP